MELPSHILGLLNGVNTTKILGVSAADGSLELTPLIMVKAPTSDLILLPQTQDKTIQDLLAQTMEQGRAVSILCLEQLQGETRAYQLECAVREYQTAGPLYEKFMEGLRVSYADLLGVWVLEPQTIKERH